MPKNIIPGKIKYNLAEIFKTKGTLFTKYGRYGKPKLRLVQLSEDESEIIWRDPKKPNEKARKMLVKELEAVIMGSDQTQVMRKHKD